MMDPFADPDHVDQHAEIESEQADEPVRPVGLFNRCPTHPTYQVKRKPTADCAQCRAMWQAKCDWAAIRYRVSRKLEQIGSATQQRIGQLIYNTLAGPDTGPCPAVFYCTDEHLLDCLNEYGKQLDNPMKEM